MPISIHGTGTITGIDQGIQISGVGTFTDNVSIGGTLTYEDVTNIDSIGIITARSGIVGDLTGNVTGNVTGDITGNVTGDITGNLAGTTTLAGISSSISDTAVDIFIYDTSKDSDGGAWRKRTQHTSWYNETLNTATRGSRREFPAVAVIVSETGSITIYDGDDPDLPMWMVFNGTVNPVNASGTMLMGNNHQLSIEMLNGVLVNGTNGQGTSKIKFISDDGYLYWNSTSTGGKFKGNISQRNSGQGYDTSQAVAIVNTTTNDVAMTVLPSAPIDSATGLPVPTIAVATGGGVSVIKDDGTVVDKATTSDPSYTVDWMSPSRLLATAPAYYGIFDDPFVEESSGYLNGTSNSAYYSGDGNGTSWNYPRPIADLVYSTAQRVIATDSRTIIAATNSGLNIHELSISSGTDNNDGIVAYATTSYNTGYQVGDIKGAFLSDTDATNLVYTDLLGGKGTFDDASYWTLDSNWSIGSGVATSNGSNGYIARSGVLTTGARHVITITITSYTSGVLYVYAGTGAPGLNNHYYGVSSAGTFILTLDAYNTSFGLYSSGFIGSVDNVSVSSVVDQDRSVNGKNLGVIGTITKSPVAGSGATAAELVGYSGYSNSNYLKQPYNSDLDFGTGDFSVTWWQYITGDIAASEYVYDRQGSNGNRHAVIYYSANGGRMSLYTNDGSTSEILYDGINVYKNQWTCYTITRNSSGTIDLYINGELKQSTALTVRNLTNASAELFIGIRHSVNTGAATQAKYALLRFSKSIPSAAQVKKMYDDEKVLFQENAACTLYGSSDAVTALAYDEVTDRLHVGTSSGRSDFQGLRRINNTTTAVTTAISAHDEFIAEQ